MNHTSPLDRLRARAAHYRALAAAESDTIKAAEYQEIADLLQLDADAAAEAAPRKGSLPS